MTQGSKPNSHCSLPLQRQLSWQVLHWPQKLHSPFLIFSDQDGLDEDGIPGASSDDQVNLGTPGKGYKGYLDSWLFQCSELVVLEQYFKRHPTTKFNKTPSAKYILL